MIQIRNKYIIIVMSAGKALALRVNSRQLSGKLKRIFASISALRPSLSVSSSYVPLLRKDEVLKLSLSINNSFSF